MRAIRFDGKHAVLVQDAPEPTPGPGEAVVRIARAGVADADLAVVRGAGDGSGSGPAPPLILGHELVGVVERIEASPSPAREPLQSLVGQRVVAAIELACGKCDLCRRGLSNHCREMALIGLSGRDGCFADRIAIPCRALAPLPPSVSDDAAVFALGAAAALHAAQMVRLEGRGYITVLGDNTPALLAVQAMARLNASVRLVGSDPSVFTRAEKWGIKHRHADEVGRRQDQDVVMDCTGSAAGLDLALRLVRPRGTVILGGHPAPPAWQTAATELDLSPVSRHEIEVVGSRGGRVADGVAALAEGRFDVLGLITRRVRLADGVAALRAAGEAGQVKVLIEA